MDSTANTKKRFGISCLALLLGFKTYYCIVILLHSYTYCCRATDVMYDICCIIVYFWRGYKNKSRNPTLGFHHLNSHTKSATFSDPINCQKISNYTSSLGQTPRETPLPAQRWFSCLPPCEDPVGHRRAGVGESHASHFLFHFGATDTSLKPNQLPCLRKNKRLLSLHFPCSSAFISRCCQIPS